MDNDPHENRALSPRERRTSLRRSALKDVDEMLSIAGFVDASSISAALLGVVDLIHSYTEEGVRLYPELVVTTSMKEILAPIAVQRFVTVGETSTEEAFRHVLKSCAPLARAGWTVFVEIQEGRARYGVVSVEGTELSPTLYAQLVGDLAPEISTAPVIYVKGIGSRQVELRTLNSKHCVALTLADISADEDQLSHFATIIVRDIPEPRRVIAQAFMRKLLSDAVQQSHGCLLAVVDESEQSKARFKARLPDGKYLEPTIDFAALLQQSDEVRNREASTAVRSYVELAKAMVGLDGITAFSTRAELFGFNIFVSQTSGRMQILGGARHRAAQSLHDADCTLGCLAVSHDGGMITKEKPNDA